jgi:16S rRNA (adenine1518-N6/adenine1519-N6)-dimethyltransferase
LIDRRITPPNRAADAGPANLRPLREIIARYGLSPRRGLGQHFLLDLNLTARIARAAGELRGRNVIEVGPGPGGLTRALLEAGADRVVAVERDRRCVAALEDLAFAFPQRLVVVEADALALDVAKLARPPRRIVSNLPYNISVPLLLGWLRHARDYESLTLMFQKEVAERLTAGPSTKAYGRLSVMAQWQCRVCKQFDVDRHAFVPQPKVHGSVLTLTPRAQVIEADWAPLEAVVAHAFGQRRKMLRTSLRPLGLDLANLGVTGTARAEELAIEDFCRLARALGARS